MNSSEIVWGYLATGCFEYPHQQLSPGNNQTIRNPADGRCGGADPRGEFGQGDPVGSKEVRQSHELRFTLNVSDSQDYMAMQGFPCVTNNVRISGNNAEAAVAIHHTLREARTRIGMSQDEAAKHLGISGASFSRMESGESAITTDRLVRLAALYKVSAASLLEGAVVTHPSAVDLDRLKLAIIEVEKVVSALGVRPSPQKVADAVAELYRTEIEFIIEHPRETFTPARHIRLLELIFRA